MAWGLIGIAIGGLLSLLVLFRCRRKVASLEETVRRRSQEKRIVVDFIHNMVSALGDGLTREELFERIAHASILSTGALSSCVFEVTERQTLRSVATEGLFPPHRPFNDATQARLTTRTKYIEQIMQSEEFPIGEGAVGAVAESCRAELIADGLRDPRIVQSDDPSLIVRTAIIAPILFRERLIGVLAVVNTADGLPFNETDFSLVESLAEQAGMAVRNNEFLHLQIERKQLDVDLALARNIQLMLVQRALPVVPGLDFDARYIPSHSVGGDLYDVIKLDERKVAVVVGDVSGKGISAAMIMAICRTSIRHFANSSSPPAETLASVNHAMEGEFLQGMFITLLYAVIDLDSSSIAYARAGHEQPLLCRADATGPRPEVQPLNGEGMALGLVDGAFFESVIEDRQASFEEGDCFVAFTDGLTEMDNPDGKEFSSARLADTVASFSTLGAAELNASILERLNRFAGDSRYHDDLTLVTVKRVPRRGD